MCLPTPPPAGPSHFPPWPMVPSPGRAAHSNHLLPLDRRLALMASISVPTAILIGAGTTAATGLASSAIGASAATSAAKTQATAAMNSAQLQAQMFQQIQGNLAPYMNIGQGATPIVEGLLGTSGSTSGPQKQLQALQSQYAALPPDQQKTQAGQSLQSQIA